MDFEKWISIMPSALCMTLLTLFLWPSQLSASALSGASDVVVVAKNNSDFLVSTRFRVHIGKLDNWRTLFYSRQHRSMQLWVNNKHVDDLKLDGDGRGCFLPTCSLHPTSLTSYMLKPGPNSALYIVPDLKVEVSFTIFVLSSTSSLIISDVDGTITRDDLRGFLVPQILDLSHNHVGVANLLKLLETRGYTIVYVTARPTDVADTTRDYLFRHKQSLPLGPLLLSPSSSLPSTLIRGAYRPHTLKTPVLKELVNLFERSKEGQKVVFGAFGNRFEDALAYIEAGVNPDNVFIVDDDDEDEMEVDNVVSFESYNNLIRHVDHLFPPL